MVLTVCENPKCPNYKMIADRAQGNPCGVCKKPVRQLNPPPPRRGHRNGGRRLRIVADVIIKIP